MGGLKGQRIHEASYTNVNQFEEIRSLSLVPSKSLSFVVDQLKGVGRGLEENGHPPCSLIYTDSPQSMNLINILFFNSNTLTAEQAFHEDITPSLKSDVEHVTLFTDLPLFQYPDDSVPTQFTDDTFLMDSLCDEILEKVNAAASQLHVIALAVQSSSSAIHAIQLRTDQYNIVFRVCHIFSSHGLRYSMLDLDNRVCYTCTFSTVTPHYLDK